MVVLEFSHIFLHELLMVEGERLDPVVEIAYAFIPGQEPLVGKKFKVD